MELPYSNQYLTDESYRTIRQINSSDCYLRLTITRGVGPLGLDPDLSLKPNLVIIAKSEHTPNQKIYRDGVHVIITEILKTDKDSIDPNLKSGNYLNNILAFQEAKKQGAYDAIMLNRDGMISEATTANVWMVDSKGNFITPPLAAGILEGITRQTIMRVARELNLTIIERNINRSDLINASECFLSSSFKELVPIIKIDSSFIGASTPGPYYQKIHQAYRQAVNSYTLAKKV
jgi:branched-chain amino acid aminotransferase